MWTQQAHAHRDTQPGDTPLNRLADADLRRQKMMAKVNDLMF